MKTIKLLIIFCIALLGFQQVNAQLDATFYYGDSCDIGQTYIWFYANNCAYDAYYFDFGDGNSDTTSCNIDHGYTNPGTYTVSLTVFNNGQSNTSSQTIQVLPPNFVSFTYNGGSSCSMPQVYTFIGNQTNPNNPITDWYWYVNNQYVGQNQNLTYTFNQPGSYNVMLSGYTANGCYSEQLQTITVGQSNLTAGATYSLINQDCQGAMVNLSSTVSGGTPPYTYNWTWYDFGNSTQANPTQVYVLNSVDSTVYLSVTDANGCSVSTQVAIPFTGSSFTASVNSNPSSSCGTTCDGSITAVATGSVGPYTFTLSNGNSQTGYQTVFNNLCEGQYTVTVYDQNQCSQSYSVYVQGDSLSQMQVYATANNGSACSALTVCQGSINVSAFGGTAPFQYSIDGGSTFQSSSSFTSVCPGTYVVVAQDAAGCSNVYTVVVGAPDSISVIREEYYANCTNNSTQSSFIGVYPQGGSGTYSYLWNDGSTQEYIIDPTQGTTYSVIIDDGNGCTASETFNVPSNNCYTITGHVYVDANNNCIYDSGDYPLSCWVDLTATAGGPWLWIYDYTDATGYYEISAAAGTYFFDINGYNANNLTLNCPNSNFSVTLDSTNQTANVDFFLSPPVPIQDLSISIGHYTNVAPSTIPSHNRWSYIEICNDGTYPMSGYAEWHYSSELTYAGPPSWSTIFPDVVDQANHTLTFNFVNLMPGQCKYIRINFDVPNTLPIGTVIDDEAVVYPIAGDVTPANNTAYTSVLSEGSWDPNDKSVYPNGDITIDDNDHNYHIRFQNEGNANATRVIVKDELDSDLALHSLRNVSASHDYIMTVENNNTLVFTFNNIQLPPKTVDEAASQGWVNFTISQDGDLPVGTEIENTAAIYFDFNEAVITNTVVNTIVEKATGIQDAELLNALMVYPNPSKGIYTVSIDKNVAVQSINVYDVVGNKILTMSEIGSNQLLINLQNSPTGIYLLEIITVDSKASAKLIKQ